MMKKTIFSLFLFVLLTNTALAQQSSLFDYESVQTFSPDLSVDISTEAGKKEAVNKEIINSLQFQIADPKGIHLPEKVVSDKPAKPEKKAKIENKLDEVTEKTHSKKEIKPELKPEVEIIESVDYEKVETEELKEDKKSKISTDEKENKPVSFSKEDIKLTIQSESLEEAYNEESIDFNKIENDLKSIRLETDKIKAFLESEESTNSISEDSEEIAFTPPEEIDNTEDPDPAFIIIDEAEQEKRLSELLKKSNNENIDYYLKKYGSTLRGGANITDYKHSLMEPFKQSFFYQLLSENNSKNIELQTHDVTADFKPEAVVSYNIPLGAEGEFACQIMVLQPSDPELVNLWISEQIPGEIDSVMVQDVNNDAQKDIIAISTSGGVSLLKSIRVYSYNKNRHTFDTIFAVNGIMEGIVTVRPGKILVSETFPGGINRAALYIWNGKRFERLEL
jgi:hypothetical protein